jgi:hypothetical protein
MVSSEVAYDGKFKSSFSESNRRWQFCPHSGELELRILKDPHFTFFSKMSVLFMRVEGAQLLWQMTAAEIQDTTESVTVRFGDDSHLSNGTTD